MVRISPEAAERRAARLPIPTYPAELPITALRDELLETIAQNQVIVVAGETGSGKSTQLPKLCLELGLGAKGYIGHTQPRRLAARAVAERVSEELGTSVGDLVGYTVRFNDQVSEDTLVKVMTDGILLAEIQRDPKLWNYDVIIIDEAHERSLNIDFLLGYLKNLLPKRPDLKLIITSATIDTEKFSQHFRNAPIVEVSGRSYPVEIVYAPPLADDETEDSASSDGRYNQIGDALPQAIVEAAKRCRSDGPGDILVFCAGERDIKDAADALRAQNWSQTEILPLYARLSSADQHKVFSPHTGRRIVLATNVAETSLTVPGIRYVIDPGFARISRFNHRTKVQRLPIEEISQASANQRAGRCGRVGPGVCIRLYSEANFLERPDFTEPEIQRTNLASVILQMAAQRLGKVEDFPFVDPPDQRAIRDGTTLLWELGALNPDLEGKKGWLTPLGKRLARLPIDPRLARIILEAERNGCVREILIIVAALSVLDPREYPRDEESLAAAEHKRFNVPGSDFLAYLMLWEYIRDVRKAKSTNQYRKTLRNEYLNVNRIREWRELFRQLRQICGELNIRLNRISDSIDNDAIHRSLLAGFLSHIGMKDPQSREYRGARDTRFVISPRSGAARKEPKWIVAAELVETNRLWAHTVASIQPEWLEQSAKHLAKYSYSDAWWSRAQGQAETHERVSLFGLPIISQRKIAVARVDQELAHEMFVWHALSLGDWDGSYPFTQVNESLRQEILTLEERARQRLVKDRQDVSEWYARAIPSQVVSSKTFAKWWKTHHRSNPQALWMSLDDLLVPGTKFNPQDYPDTWQSAGCTFTLDYEYDETSVADGLVVQVPITRLANLSPQEFSWNIKGYRQNLIYALLKSLPKAKRRTLSPLLPPVEYLTCVIEYNPQIFLTEALSEALREHYGLEITPSDFDLSLVPDHLLPTFEVIDNKNEALAYGKSLPALRQLLASQIEEAFSNLDSKWRAHGLQSFPSFDITKTITLEDQCGKIIAFPALYDEGTSVGLHLAATSSQQWAEMWDATFRLLEHQNAAVTRALGRMLSNSDQLALVRSPWRNEGAWARDVLAAALEHFIQENNGPSFDQAGFAKLARTTKEQLPRLFRTIAPAALAVLRLDAKIQKHLAKMVQPAFVEAASDVQIQLQRLLYPGVFRSVGLARIPDLVRYLEAIDYRLRRLPNELDKDHRRMSLCVKLEEELDAKADHASNSAALDEVSWLLQELRVATFAQHLGTAAPVSEKRIRAAMAKA